MAKVRQLRLLESLAQTCVLPEAVAMEILNGPPGDAARAAVAGGWGSRRAPRQIPVSVLEWGLGAGETAVLALAMEMPPATAVLDDAGARAAARVLGVPVIGTLGIIVRAKQRGLVPSAATIMAELQAAGLYLDQMTVRAALERLGEPWPAV